VEKRLAEMSVEWLVGMQAETVFAKVWLPRQILREEACNNLLALNFVFSNKLYAIFTDNRITWSCCGLS
jgi:hypothetical protein